MYYWNEAMTCISLASVTLWVLSFNLHWLDAEAMSIIELINVDVDVTKSRQTELYLGCLPFKQNSRNFGWEFSFGKNGTCRLPFAKNFRIVAPR